VLLGEELCDGFGFGFEEFGDFVAGEGEFVVGVLGELEAPGDLGVVGGLAKALEEGDDGVYDGVLKGGYVFGEVCEGWGLGWC